MNQSLVVLLFGSRGQLLNANAVKHLGCVADTAIRMFAELLGGLDEAAYTGGGGRWLLRHRPAAISVPFSRSWLFRASLSRPGYLPGPGCSACISFS